MGKKQAKIGRPPKSPGHGMKTLMQIRLMAPEKQGFLDAAELSGQELSVWVRNALRQAAQAQLQENGREVPFLSSLPLGKMP